jgi:hypothetical protein
MEVNGNLQAPGSFTPKKERRYLLCSPRAGMDDLEKRFLPLLGFEPGGFQVIAWVIYDFFCSAVYQ